MCRRFCSPYGRSWRLLGHTLVPIWCQNVAKNGTNMAPSSRHNCALIVPSFLSPLWALLERSWALLGRSLGTLWCQTGANMVPKEYQTGAKFSAQLCLNCAVRSAAHGGALGALLGAPWAHVGRFWGALNDCVGWWSQNGRQLSRLRWQGCPCPRAGGLGTRIEWSSRCLGLQQSGSLLLHYERIYLFVYIYLYLYLFV